MRVRPLLQIAPFQCSSASRKFLKPVAVQPVAQFPYDVSVLFSEPKIPQIEPDRRFAQPAEVFQCSSASRKFLKTDASSATSRAFGFQCSSASRKFLKDARTGEHSTASAFQCSSASRKFLKFPYPRKRTKTEYGFSALQRAENSSNGMPQARVHAGRCFSALQRAENSSNKAPNRTRAATI